ncbi:MAG: GNAT family N-acetyltransferase [Candidatus Omnitrophica bacterium]|nr:GNAT family N-acetyltransferase [Candidatus Omnitrophota bacterium]
MQDCFVRKFVPADKEQVRQIAWETAFRGGPADIFFDDKRFLCDALIRYFTDEEPESCFVAECGGRVAGYLVGSKDTHRMGRIFLVKILPGLLGRLFFGPVLFSAKNRRFLGRLFLSCARGELRLPPIPGDDRATLHINCREEFRSRGLGKRLIEAYLEYLRSCGRSEVRLCTASETGRDFFEHMEFSVLFSAKRSYWTHLLGHDFSVYIMGRRIS